MGTRDDFAYGDISSNVCSECVKTGKPPSAEEIAGVLKAMGVPEKDIDKALRIWKESQKRPDQSRDKI